MDYEESQRLVAGAEAPEDLEDVSLRPRKFEEYIGQEKVRANLSVFIEAAKQRKEPLDHVLLYGPPGLGKTTLAGIIASELGVSLRITTGPAIEKAADLAGSRRAIASSGSSEVYARRRDHARRASDRAAARSIRGYQPAGNVRRLRAFPDRASFRKYFTRRNRRYGSARDRPALTRHAQNRKQASEART